MPGGFSAAETTKRIGKIEKTSARTPTRWLQPTAAEPAALGAAEPDDLGRVAVGARVASGAVGCRDGHQLISSRAWVRRKLTIETIATIRKMKTEMAAAKPYWAPEPPNASR